MRAGLLSNEMKIVRSAEVVSRAEGKTARTASVRSGRAPRCRRTQARMYVQSRDLGGLSVTTVQCAVVAEVNAVAKRRMHGGEESDAGIVPGKRANKAWGATWRSQWREGLGATGDAKERPCSEHRVGKPLVGLDAGPERSGTAVPEGCRHNRSEEPDALARTSGSGRGPSGNRRATATRFSLRTSLSPAICCLVILTPVRYCWRMGLPQPTTDPPPDYRKRFEQLSGDSLRQCPAGRSGLMLCMETFEPGTRLRCSRTPRDPPPTGQTAPTPRPSVAERATCAATASGASAPASSPTARSSDHGPTVAPRLHSTLRASCPGLAILIASADAPR